MNKFINRVFTYVSVLAIIVIACAGVHYWILSKVSFKLPQEKNILVLGDSSTADAISDRIYSSTINVSSLATAYLYSYCKLDRFLRENSHIDTVLLAFSNDAICSADNDKKNAKAFETQNMMRKFPHYFTSFDREIIPVFIKENREAFLPAVLNIHISMIVKFILSGGAISYEYLRLGAYVHLHRDSLKEDIIRTNQTAKEPVLSVIQLQYLLKIVDLCKSNNVTLILINTPTYKPDIYGDIDEVDEIYRTYLSEVDYMDYSAFPLPDSCYGDITHLNYKGAEIFSRYLEEHLSTDKKSNIHFKYTLTPPPSAPADTTSTKPCCP